MNEWNKIKQALLDWYRKEHRQLRWRETKDPYEIWISEIMLQQTRVEAVKGYYDRFLETLPDVEHLANVDDDVLLKLWEGLGYYNRARNLKKAAIQICETYQGQFPTEYEQVLGLSGIGVFDNKNDADQFIRSLSGTPYDQYVEIEKILSDARYQHLSEGGKPVMLSLKEKADGTYVYTVAAYLRGVAHSAYYKEQISSISSMEQIEQIARGIQRDLR